MLTTTRIITTSPPTGFSRVDAMMLHARAKYAANPSLASQASADTQAKLPKALPPTPESLAFDERADGAVAGSSSLLAGLQAQLNAPVSDFLPAELTSAEMAEQVDADRWAREYQFADQMIDRMLTWSQKLLAEIVGLTDELQVSDLDALDDLKVYSPPATPLATSSGGVKGPETQHKPLLSLLTSANHLAAAPSADPTTARTTAKSVEKGETPVSALVSLYNDLGGPYRSAGLSSARKRAVCRENFPPCRNTQSKDSKTPDSRKSTSIICFLGFGPC